MMETQKKKIEKGVVYYDIAHIMKHSGLSEPTVKKYAKVKDQPMRGGRFLWTYLEATRYLEWLRITFPHRFKKRKGA